MLPTNPVEEQQPLRQHLVNNGGPEVKQDVEDEDEGEEEGVIRCICGYTHDDGFTIQCEKCLVWQHAVCVTISKNNVPDRYYCEECEPRELDIEYAQTMQRKKIYKSGSATGTNGKVNRRCGSVRMPSNTSAVQAAPVDLGPMILVPGRNLPSYQLRIQEDSDYYDELDDLAQDYVPVSSLAFQSQEVKDELLLLTLPAFKNEIQVESENSSGQDDHKQHPVGLRRRENDIALVATSALSKGKIARVFGQLIRQDIENRPEKYVFNLYSSSAAAASGEVDAGLITDYLLDCRRFGCEWRFARYSDTPNCIFVLEKNVGEVDGNEGPNVSIAVYMTEDVDKDTELTIRLPPGVTSNDLPASHRSSLYHLDDPMIEDSNEMVAEEKEEEEIVRVPRPQTPPPNVAPVLSQEQRQTYEMQLREELHNFSINQSGGKLLVNKTKNTPFSFMPLPHEQPRRNLKAEWIKRWDDPIEVSTEDDVSLCGSLSSSEDEAENAEMPPPLVNITHAILPPTKRWLANSKSKPDVPALSVKTSELTESMESLSNVSAAGTQETNSAVTTAANSPLVGVKRAATDEPTSAATRISFMDYKKKRKLASSSTVSLASTTSDSAANPAVSTVTYGSSQETTEK